MTTLVTVRCERCDKEIEVASNAVAWHVLCPKRVKREPAPLYRRIR